MNESASAAKYQAIYFDLDGTLVDTAPDLINTVNILRETRNLPPVPIADIRHCISYGSTALITNAFGIGKDHPTFLSLQQQFLEIYRDNICNESQLFPGMSQLIKLLQDSNTPWGIVTSKSERFTFPLLEKLGLDQLTQCIVCGDTTLFMKPHPAPLILANQKLNTNPLNCLFIGDSINDIQAGYRSGMTTVTALYGYIAPSDSPVDWRANYMVDHAQELEQIIFPPIQ